MMHVIFLRVLRSLCCIKNVYKNKRQDNNATVSNVSESIIVRLVSFLSKM